MGSRSQCVLLALALTSVAPASRGAIPEVLIIQRLVDAKRGEDPNVEIGDYVAQEFADDGRVSPIYWSKNDPIFRAMVQSGKVTSTDVPSVDKAIEIARAQKIAFVMFVEAHKDRSGAILSRAELYKGSDSALWVDPSEATTAGGDIIKRLLKSGKLSQLDADKLGEANGYRKSSIGSEGGTDLYNTLHSLARTWSEQLGTGPWQGMQARTRVVTPDPVAGPIARLDTTQPQVPKNVDNAEVFRNVDAALKDGRKDLAILILRDAVDSQPFDLPRREALIKLLNETGHPELAALEASRAAALSPGSGDFRLEGARAQLTAGNLDAAESSAKDALAHDPKSPEANLVLGEVNLARFNFPAALINLDAACAGTATTEAVYYRAIAKVFAGDVPGAASDCEAAHHGSLVQAVPPYDSTLKLFDGGVQQSFDTMRNLLSTAAIGANNADAVAQATKVQSVATAAAAFLSSWPPAKYHSPSHERRILALKLLSQASGEVLGYLTKHDDESLTDARIDLGEAMKQYKSAKELFGGEAAE